MTTPRIDATIVATILKTNHIPGVFVCVRPDSDTITVTTNGFMVYFKDKSYFNIMLNYISSVGGGKIINGGVQNVKISHADKSFRELSSFHDTLMFIEYNENRLWMKFSSILLEDNDDYALPRQSSG